MMSEKTILKRIIRLENQVDALTKAQTTSTEHFERLNLQNIAQMVDTLAISRHRAQSDYREMLHKMRVIYPMTIIALVYSVIALYVVLLK